MTEGREDVPRAGTMEEYEARRCAICGRRYPTFGYGPPLTPRELWVCGEHREEIERRLRDPGRAPAEPDQQQMTFRSK